MRSPAANVGDPLFVTSEVVDATALNLTVRLAEADCDHILVAAALAGDLDQRAFPVVKRSLLYGEGDHGFCLILLRHLESLLAAVLFLLGDGPPAALADRRLQHRSTVSKMAARFKAKILTPYGLRTCFEARVEREGRSPLVARFGGIPLKRHKRAVLTDRTSPGPAYPPKVLIKRLRTGRCELCQQTDDMQVHHVRQLADLDRTGEPPPSWAQIMRTKRRKSLVVCGDCHDIIHGRPAASLT